MSVSAAFARMHLRRHEANFNLDATAIVSGEEEIEENPRSRSAKYEAQARPRLISSSEFRLQAALLNDAA